MSSTQGTLFVAVREGLRTRAYRDSGGVWTIGYGFTMASRIFSAWWLARHDHPLRAGDTITPSDALDLLERLLTNEYGPPVDRRFGALPVYRSDACTSVSYNAGPGALQDRWAGLLAAGDVAGAAASLRLDRTSAGGHTVQGLVNRRADEAKLLETGDYGLAHQLPPHLQPSVSTSHDEVREYQSQLATLGFYRGADDGIAGPVTWAAVVAFQKAHDLVADGIVGPATRTVLARAVAVETGPRYRLGRKLPAGARPKLQLAKYVARPAALAQVPLDFGYEGNLPSPVPMLGNDDFGDCVWADAAHSTQVWNVFRGVHVTFTDASVLGDYSAVTGFRVDDSSTDQGTDMRVAASYRRKTGVADAGGARHPIAGYGDVTPGDLDLLKYFTWLLGAVSLGVVVSDAQVDQTNGSLPWEGPLTTGVGGHCVTVVGFRAGYFLVVSWGQLQKVAPAFLMANCDEVIACLSDEFMNAGRSPTGLDLPALQADLLGYISAPSAPTARENTMTIKTLTDAEVAAAKPAVQAKLNELVPPWKQHLIGNEDDLLTQLVTAAVAAVDIVRDSQPQA